MLTLSHILYAMMHMLDNLGAHHYYSQIFGSNRTGNGYIATKHWLLPMCHIPSNFNITQVHHTFSCTTTIRNGVFHIHSTIIK